MHVDKILSIQHWQHLWQDRGDDIVLGLIKIAIIIMGYLALRLVISKVIRSTMTSLMKASGDLLKARHARVKSLQSVLISASTFVMTFIAGVMLLQAVGINVVSLLTAAGVAGLAIGFGAQKLVKDVINGFFILMEDQYGVGDYVTIGAVTGVVEELGMRTTRIRDSQGKVYTLSNGDIIQVCNYCRGQFRMSVDIAVPASNDVEKAREILNGVGARLAQDLPERIREPFAVDGVPSISGASVTLRLTGGVSAKHQDEIRMELNERVRAAFLENDLVLA